MACVFLLLVHKTYLAVDTHPIHHAKRSKVVVIVFVVIMGQGITRSAGSSNTTRVVLVGRGRDRRIWRNWSWGGQRGSLWVSETETKVFCFKNFVSLVLLLSSFNFLFSLSLKTFCGFKLWIFAPKLEILYQVLKHFHNLIQIFFLFFLCKFFWKIWIFALKIGFLAKKEQFWQKVLSWHFNLCRCKLGR